MNDRARAIAILQKARDILIDRLTERVAESGEEIVDEALGHSYGTVIESLYEQLGARLQNITTLLSQLPPAAHDPYDTIAYELPQFGADAADEAAQEGRLFAGGLEQLAEASGVQVILSPHGGNSIAPQESTPQGTANVALSAGFQSFIKQIMTDDLPAAAISLAELFDVDAERALKCAATFSQRMNEQADLLEKAMQLRGELQADSSNGVVMLLWECFGLQGMESIGVMQALKARLNPDQ